MSLQRQVERNQMKSWQKNNKISTEWKNFQIQKYGLGNYEDMQRANKKKKRANKKKRG